MTHHRVLLKCVSISGLVVSNRCLVAIFQRVGMSTERMSLSPTEDVVQPIKKEFSWVSAVGYKNLFAHKILIFSNRP